MKKLASLGLSLIAGILCSTAAQAETTQRYHCTLDGHIHGVSIGIGLSGQELHGPGRLTCRDRQTGHRESRRVELNLVGIGIGFDFTIVKSMRVHSSGIETAVGFPDFDRSFNVGAIAGVTVVDDGVSVDSAVQVSDEQLGFELGFIGERAIGLGARLQGMVFTIKPI